MTLKIDFYLTQLPNFSTCATLCARLAQQQFTQGDNITIILNELDANAAVSQALWETDASSFLPSTSDLNMNKIYINHPLHTTTTTQINMQVTDTNLTESVQQLIQIVPNNEADKALARELYRHFQQLGHSITVHKDA